MCACALVLLVVCVSHTGVCADPVVQMMAPQGTGGLTVQQMQAQVVSSVQTSQYTARVTVLVPEISPCSDHTVRCPDVPAISVQVSSSSRTATGRTFTWKAHPMPSARGLPFPSSGLSFGGFTVRSRAVDFVKMSTLPAARAQVPLTTADFTVTIGDIAITDFSIHTTCHSAGVCDNSAIVTSAHSQTEDAIEYEVVHRCHTHHSSPNSHHHSF